MPKVRAQNQPWYSGIAIAILTDDDRGMGAVRNLQIETLGEGECCPIAMTLRKDEAQLLMDDLWHCGIRPSEGSGSAGQLAATQKHLEDMRKITFKKLEIK